MNGFFSSDAWQPSNEHAGSMWPRGQAEEPTSWCRTVEDFWVLPRVSRRAWRKSFQLGLVLLGMFLTWTHDEGVLWVRCSSGSHSQKLLWVRNWDLLNVLAAGFSENVGLIQMYPSLDCGSDNMLCVS